jgi:hypothetical protein
VECMPKVMSSAIFTMKDIRQIKNYVEGVIYHSIVSF